MKVTGSGPGSADKARDITGTGSAGAVGPSKEGRRSGKSREVTSDVADRVAISGRAKDIAKANELAHSAPDVNEAKIARLKSAIEGGAYKVDADKVADKLVDEHLLNAF